MNPAQTPDIALADDCPAAENPESTPMRYVCAHPVVCELLDRFGLCVSFDEDFRLFYLHRSGDGVPLNRAANVYEFVAFCTHVLRRELCREWQVSEDGITLDEVRQLCRECAGCESVVTNLVVQEYCE